ncbi:MAG TPA: hypothetical protein VFN68_01755 [Acidimicrobiales bacterium]|nr:hypothetical protein [Acidimicrobiales bacterium]
MTGAGVGATADLVEVRILGLPLDIWEKSQAHVDDLLREFTLLVDGTRDHHSRHVPARLLALVERVQRDYDGMTTEQQSQLIDAAQQGAESIDLTYQVPAGAAAAAEALAAELDAADEFCRSGDYLLTLATPPEALAFRRWFLGEFSNQISGRAPTPWPQWREAAAAD